MIAEPKVFIAVEGKSYPAKITEVEPAKGQYGPQWRWTFNLGNVENLEGEVEEKTLTYYTPDYITAGNKLGKMLIALGIPIDQPFDSNDLIGKMVTLSVTEIVRDDGTTGNGIGAVLPPRKKAGANGTAAPAKAAEPAADEDEEIAVADDGIPW